MSILKGIRVVEVGTYIFGPAAATVMSDFGAEVVKIEPPGGDPYRYLYLLPPLPSCEKNYCWTLDARNKKSVAVNLKHEAGREIVLKLVRDADVFLTNYHPSVLTKLRLTYDELHPLNNRLIYAHGTGYGETGDEIEKPGFDMTAYWARSGLMAGVRNADGDPALALAGMGDHPSSVSLFAGIMLALFQRERTNRGTKVSTSLMANGAWANGCNIQAALCGGEPYQLRTRATACSALVNHYATRDGKRFILCCIQTAKDWPALCRAVGRADLLEDPKFSKAEPRLRNTPELIAIFDAAFASKDMAEWREIFERHEVTYGPVPGAEDLPGDEQMKANGVLVPIEGAESGEWTVNSPINLRGEEKVKPRPAPEIGEHTFEVLGALGYGQAEIESLLDAGSIVAAGRERRN